VFEIVVSKLKSEKFDGKIILICNKIANILGLNNCFIMYFGSENLNNTHYKTRLMGLEFLKPQINPIPGVK